jgi:hypothetical protein
MGRPDSFNKVMPLGRGEASCRHDRHFHGFMRSIVHKLDYKGAESEKNFGKRFCFAKWDYFQRMCQNTKHERPSRREVFYCLERAVALGIAVPGVCDIAGDVRHGWWIAEHATITEILGRNCLWCGDAPARALAWFQAPIQAEKRGVDCTVDCTGFGISASSKPHSETDADACVYSTSGDALGSSAPSKLHQRSLRSSQGRTKDTERERQNQSQNPAAESAAVACETPTSPDLTLTAEAEHTVEVKNLIGEELDRVLDAITDGEFQTTALEKYPSVVELADTCQQIFKSNPAFIIRGRRDCKRICELVNTEMRNERHIDVPGGWVPVLKALRSGGPLQFRISPEYVDPEEAAALAIQRAQRAAEMEAADKAYTERCAKKSSTGEVTHGSSGRDSS